MATLTIVVITLVAVMTAQLTQTMGLQESIPETTAGNITEPIAPQGTSVGVMDNTSASVNQILSSSGNITEPIAPQGTSVDVTNDTSKVNIPETTAGNITEPIAPG
ncbi:MAG TPA: hypothetical protein VKA95_11325 [Nitrososphaeraceae archaeon]|nr:hypothetical protein [Nitrososphaeraceae archaeon]